MKHCTSKNHCSWLMMTCMHTHTHTTHTHRCLLDIDSHQFALKVASSNVLTEQELEKQHTKHLKSHPHGSLAHRDTFRTFCCSENCLLEARKVTSRVVDALRCSPGCSGVQTAGDCVKLALLRNTALVSKRFATHAKRHKAEAQAARKAARGGSQFLAGENTHTCTCTHRTHMHVVVSSLTMACTQQHNARAQRRVAMHSPCLHTTCHAVATHAHTHHVS